MDGQLSIDAGPNPRARIRSLESSNASFRRLSKWNPYILRLSWATHFILLLWMVVQGGDFTLRNRNFYVSYGILIGATLLLEILEIALHSGNALRPALFVAFQALKVISWTSYRIHSLQCLASHWRQPARCTRKSAFEELWFLTCVPIVSFASLVYAVFVLRQERKEKRSYYYSATGCSFNHEESEVGSDSEGRSLEVNQAENLRTTSSPGLRLLAWLDKSQPRTDPAQSATEGFACWMVFVWKYILVSIICVPVFALSKRLPGAPKTVQSYGVLEIESLRMATWNYLKVLVPRTEHYTDEQPEEVHSRRESDSMTLSMRPSRSASSLRTMSGLKQLSRETTFSNWSSSQSSYTRLLGPRYLCFVDVTDGATDGPGYTTMSREDWKAIHGQNDPPYVFISYTRRQFCTQIWNDPSIDLERAEVIADAVDRDRDLITERALKAARTAGVPAFWLDFECVRPEEDDSTDDSMEDVYRICDIVRAAHSLAIVLGPPLDSGMQRPVDLESSDNMRDWLQDWGSRLWTVPEALLAPSEHRIALLYLGSTEAELIAKRNFASRAYEDADAMQQLVDHFESSLLLTPLQFISLALECLQRRQTQKRLAGDVSYALQGLLRQRPRVVKTDSDFQAFARLSLANDSDMLLERLLCLGKAELCAPWHDLSDTWSARLWDISPLCQVADIVDSHTVSLGGTFGAMIDWESLKPIEFEGATTKRRFSWTYVYASFGVTIFMAIAPAIYGLTLSAMLQFANSDAARQQLVAVSSLLRKISVFLWIFCFAIALSIPGLLLHLQEGEVHSAQARFFGVEGIPRLEDIERRMLGASHGRLRWNSMEAASSAADDHLHQFTLIDTFTMTATLFCAAEPPAIVMVCGRERGMLRALLCSYSWASKAFVKETTLRMEAIVLERMQRMDRVRFAMSR